MSHRKRNVKGKFLSEGQPPKRSMKVTDEERELILKERAKKKK